MLFFDGNTVNAVIVFTLSLILTPYAFYSLCAVTSSRNVVSAQYLLLRFFVGVLIYVTEVKLLL